MENVRGLPQFSSKYKVLTWYAWHCWQVEVVEDIENKEEVKEQLKSDFGVCQFFISIVKCSTIIRFRRHKNAAERGV
mgnify:CR=1 FL=1